MWTDFLEEGPCGRAVRELECGLTSLRRVPVVERLESWSVD